MIDRALVAEARQLLNKARLVAEAPAASTHERVGRRAAPSGQAPPRRPPSTLDQLHSWFSEAELADSNDQMRAALARGRRELQQLGHGPKEVGESRREFHLRIVRDYRSVIAPVVARTERCSVTEVRLARTEHGLTARFGHKPG